MSTTYQEVRQRIDADLTAQFPFQLNFAVADYAKIAHVSEANIRVQISKGSFPVPTFKSGGRRLIAKQAVVDYFAELTFAAQKRKPGRPTKLSKIIAAHQAAAGV